MPMRHQDSDRLSRTSMSEPRTPSLKETFVIQNRLGLHARVAALFVQAVAGLDADLFVSKDDETVDGKSIMGLILLGAGVGSSINVEARGPAAEEALAKIGALI
jgi:phosphocarrier protein HPr